MYDSYIRAFRWASDRIASNPNGGVIGFITNGGWIEGNAASGMRQALADEFDSIYVLDLRGDQRTQGELSRKEGGKIFGSGSRAKVCMTFLVKRPHPQPLSINGEGSFVEGEVSPCAAISQAKYAATPSAGTPRNAPSNHHAQIYYCSVADYMTREEKLKFLEDTKSVLPLSIYGEGAGGRGLDWQQLTPDEHGDWLNKRVGGDYDTYLTMGDKKDKTIVRKVFEDFYSRGLATSRDAWCYNYSKESLQKNIRECIDYYNQQRELYANKEISDIPRDPTKISWARALENLFIKNHYINEEDGCYISSIYRPYMKSYCYYAKDLNEMIYQLPKLFPFSIMRQSPNASVNRVISVSGPSGKKNFSCLMVNHLPCLDMIEKGQCFPLYIYNTDEKKKTEEQRSLFGSASSPLAIHGEGGKGGEVDCNRTSGITDWILDQTRKQYGHDDIMKEDIFYYVYGILHCPSYREKYQNDFKKALPRIPFVER